MNIRASHLYIPIILLLSACSGGSDSTPPPSTVTTPPSTSISGSALKGPVVGGAVQVKDANGNIVTTIPANPVTDAQAQFSFTVPSDTVTPLVITVTGGIDSITGAAPDLALTTAITTLPSSGSVGGTASPLSTLAVATAQALSGGTLTAANLTTASQSVASTMGFGLPDGVDPISTVADNTNIAQILKANEAVAEMMRRTATTTGGSLASTLSDLANDLTTGSIDGTVATGITASPQAAQIAATALIQQATVSVETIANNLSITPISGTPVSGANFATSMNAAITTTQPTASGSNADVAQVAPSASFINQTNTAINVANTLAAGNPAALTALQNSVVALTPNTIPTAAQIVALNTDLGTASTALTTATNNAAVGTNVATALADTLAPVITPLGANPQTVELGTVYTELGSTVIDNIDTGLTATPNSAAVNTNVVGSYTVTYSISDAAGNTAVALRTINVTDATLPIVTPATAVSVEATGATTGVALVNPTVTDNSGAVIATASPAGPYAVGVHTITWTATDASGNTGTATQTVTVTDTTAPSIVVTSGAVTQEAGLAYNDAGATASDLVDGVLTANIVSSGVVDTGLAGVYTINYDVSDAAGNPAITAIRTVTIVDTTLPVVTAPFAVTVEATAANTAVTLGNAVVVDNSAAALTAAPSQSSFPVGTTLVTWTATDASGNVGTATQSVTVTDTTAPVITGKPLANVVAEATGVNTTVTLTQPTVTDLFAVTLTNNAPATFPVGTTVVTWTATDANGQISTTSQNVVIQDTTAPSIVVTGGAVTQEAGLAYNDGGATASDLVDGVLTVNIVASGVVNTGLAGVYTINYDVSDGAGNRSVTASRAVTIVDTTLPVVTAPAAVTVEATAANTAVALGNAVVVDNAAAALTATPSQSSFPVGTTLVTWTATDASGNMGTATQSVTVTDTTAPVITLNPLPGSIVLNSIFVDPRAIASDLVDGNVNITGAGVVDTGVIAAYTLTYDYTDVAGNPAVQVIRTVNVVNAPDTTPPVVTAPTAVNLEATGLTTTVNLGTATVTDNLDVGLTATASPTGPYAVGIHTITWTSTDAAGNLGTATQLVTITDTTPPSIILNGAAAVTLTVGATYNDANATASDIVDGDISANIVANNNVNTAIAGNYSVVFNVTDAAGNPAVSVTRNVTVAAPAANWGQSNWGQFNWQ